MIDGISWASGWSDGNILKQDLRDGIPRASQRQACLEVVRLTRIRSFAILGNSHFLICMGTYYGY